jgi:hypothetical protein
MSPQSNPPQGAAIPVLEQSIPTRRRRSSGGSHGKRRVKKQAVFFVRRGNAQKGRILVIVMFVVERLAEVAMSIGLKDGPERSQLIGSIIVSALWCAALSVGVLRRINWCRYVLIFLEFLSAAASLAYLIMILPTGLPDAIKMWMALFYGMFLLVHGGIAWTLARSRDIKRLTSHAED